MEKILLCFKQKWLKYFTSFLLFLFITGFNAKAQTEKVWTDALDYAPGQTVTFSGSGWILDEKVDILIQHTFYLTHPDEEINNVSVSSGEFYNSQYIVADWDFGEEFLVTVTGQTSGNKASCTFTDGNVKFSTSGLPNGTTVIVNYSFNSTNYSINVPTGANGSGNIDPAPAAGVIFTYTFPSTITVGSMTYYLVNSQPSSPYTITNSAVTFVGTYEQQGGSGGLLVTAPTCAQGGAFQITYTPASGSDVTVTRTTPWSFTAKKNTNYSITNIASAVNGNNYTGLPTVNGSTDGNGSSTTNLAYSDKTVPVITAKADITQTADATKCSAVVTIVAATATDNCGVGAPVGTRSDAPLTLADPYPVGTTTITWNVTDIHGNAAVPVNQTITVTDNELPVITAKADITQTADATKCSAVVTIVAATATDNCGVGAPVGTRSDAPLTLADPYPVGTTTITWNVTDIHGNAAVPVNQTITVTDNELPVITAKADITQTADATKCSAVVTIVAATATDNCGVGAPVGTRSDAPLTLADPYPVGTTTITWNVTDIHGNAAVPVNQTITVTDNELPVITAKADITQTADATKCSAVVTIVAATATDNCGVGAPVGTRSDAPLTLADPYPVGTTTITWNVTDIHGNAAVPVNQTITVTDNELPVITAKADITQTADATKCSAVVTIVAATATDNCGVGAPVGTRSDAPLTLADPYPVGTTTITWNVTDIHGNAAVPVNQTITVTDNELPVITAKADITQTADATKCSAVVTIVAATATDNCGVGAPVGTRSDAPLTLADPYPVGTTTITWNVTDIHGNAAVPVNQTITVTDNELPVITAKADITQTADATKCSAVVTIVAATATDNCGVGAPVGTRSDAPLTLADPYPVGTTTITWNVTDIHGNAAVPVNQTITVTDNELPVITAKADITQTADATKCSAVVTIVAATATDNCGVGAPVGTRSDAPLTLADPYPVGTTTITWNVTDIHGNAAVPVNQTITVTDNELPVITAKADITQTADATKCSAVVTIVAATATDNCGVGAPVGTRSDAPLTLADPYPVGTTTITWNVTDIHGNAAVPVNQTITVTDNELPVITAKADITQTADATKCSAVVTIVAATATDNCGVGAPVGTRSDAPLTLADPYPVGTTTITWNVTDIHGNAAVPVNQTITVTDNELPVITAKADITQTADATKCSAVVTIVAATATDNCGVGAPVGTRSDAPLTLADPYPVGTTTITWNVTDIHGNAAVPVNQTITVTDNELPVITAKADITQTADATKCSAVVTIVAATATDNCGVGAPVGTRSDAPLTLADPYPVGTTTITWNVTDIHGNAAVPVNQTITVTDNELPVITAKADITQTADATKCSAVVTIVAATATDNCGVGAPVGTRSDAPLTLADPYPVGTTTITWNVTDIHGNVAASVNQSVTITNTVPEITSFAANPAPIALGTSVTMTLSFTDIENNSTTATIDWGNGVVKTYSPIDPINYTYPAVGVYSVKVKLEDACGLFANSLYEYVVIYDPSGGFVTGGGWINSPAGAYISDPALTGKATFGFVSKYEKGKTIPSGNTEFQFHAAGMNFKSTSYEWLVVAGMKAQFKGIGTINGIGGYYFILSAIDGGTADKFRIKIWNELVVWFMITSIGDVDNADPGTVISGGSIVVHDGKTKTTTGTSKIQQAEFGIKAYPNPFTDHVYFDLQLKTDSKVRLEIYTIDGAKLATVYDDLVVAYDKYRFEYTPENFSTGTLIYRLVVDGQLMFTGKLIHY